MLSQPVAVFVSYSHRDDGWLEELRPHLNSLAVIASAGAVDDRIAVIFARGFYSAMMRGDPFWRAVLAARHKAYEAEPHSIAWAVYRCYGDPEFVLTGLVTSTPVVDPPPDRVS